LLKKKAAVLFFAAIRTCYPVFAVPIFFLLYAFLMRYIAFVATFGKCFSSAPVSVLMESVRIVTDNLLALILWQFCCCL